MVLSIKSSKMSSAFVKSVPRKLTIENKITCVRACQCLLNSFNNKADAFLSRIVTVDQIWVHNYWQKSKCQRMEWKPLDLQRRKTRDWAISWKGYANSFWGT
ncbi:hypothetical protein CEXT_75201 [Caerostris extrusa]|uniref:Uncharacterized protein n=1 Tax=Caerostris extrusa TaxID=172846 RepID=A0AAV4NNZ8_CAEEX|nr:hypothetical protein CEXT_75201 [Caerostris extrusa]